MKNIHKKLIPDVMKEVLENEKFQFYSRGSELRIRLATEIYNTREAKELSQQALAKRISSTQKVISKIESGDVNIGIEMFDRLSEELNFTIDNLLRIFNHIESSRTIQISSPAKQYFKKPFSFFNVEIRQYSSNITASLTSNHAQ